VRDAAPGDVRTRTGVAMGTLPYMPPEQALGKRSEIDGRVDIFALGATAFRILSRRCIHEADSDAGMLLAMASKPAPPLRSVAAEVPEHVASIVDLSLAFNKDARYPDARTMQADVRVVRRGEAPPYASARRQALDQPTRQDAPAASVPRAAPVAPISADAPTAVVHFGTPTVVAAPPAAEIAAAAAAPVAIPAPSTRLPLWSVAAVSALLLGALIWILWPTPDSSDADGVQNTNSEEAIQQPSTKEPVKGRDKPKKGAERRRKH